MARVYIPPAMQSLTNGQPMVVVSGVTVAEVISNLDRLFPGTRDRICTNNALRAGLSVVVGGSVSAMGLLQPTDPDSEIHFLPALGGG